MQQRPRSCGSRRRRLRPRDTRRGWTAQASAVDGTSAPTRATSARREFRRFVNLPSGGRVLPAAAALAAQSKPSRALRDYASTAASALATFPPPPRGWPSAQYRPQQERYRRLPSPPPPGRAYRQQVLRRASCTRACSSSAGVSPAFTSSASMRPRSASARGSTSSSSSSSSQPRKEPQPARPDNEPACRRAPARPAGICARLFCAVVLVTTILKPTSMLMP